jgi:hypothetical protein
MDWEGGRPSAAKAPARMFRTSKRRVGARSLQLRLIGIGRFYGAYLRLDRVELQRFRS